MKIWKMLVIPLSFMFVMVMASVVCVMAEGVETRVCLNDPEHSETRPIKALGHSWGEWTVTKAATETEEGEEQRVCANDPTHVETRAISKVTHALSGGDDSVTPSDGDTTPTPAPSPEPGSDPNQKGSDGTAVGPGASAAAAEKAIMNSSSEEGPNGTRYAPLKLRSTKQTQKSVKLTWTKAKGSCYIYAYAQNGVYKKIRIVVK